MNLLFDLIVILVVILCTLIGKKRGFIKTFFGFFGSLIAFVLSSVFSRPIGGWLADKVFAPTLSKVFLSNLTEKIGSVEKIDFSSLPDSVFELLEKFGTDSAKISEFVSRQSQMAQEQLESAVGEFVVNPIASAAGRASAFVALFLILSIGIRIAVRALDMISRLPFLNLSNRFLGAGIGFVWGILIAVILSGVLAVSEPAMQNTAFFSAFELEKTYLIKIFAKLDFIFS